MRAARHTMISAGALDDLPTGPGAYALLLRLTEPVEAPARAFPSAVLTPGTYLYAGSAWGPGGIRARVLRHARREKALHWHVDNLTRVADLMNVLAFPGGRECKVIERGRALPGTSVPIPGFGSSDCRSCVAHLLAVPPDSGFAALVADLVEHAPSR
jgi:Uri superfamily endonuclease